MSEKEEKKETALDQLDNTALLKAMKQLKEKDCRENLLDFLNEAYKAKFITPAIVEKQGDDTRIGFTSLRSEKNEMLIPAYTSVVHNPKIVFLDEPTIGLDVSMKAKIRELIKELNRQKKTTVILTTHDMGDVDALCERIVIIDHGKMIYDNDMEHLKNYFGSYRTLKLRLPGDIWEETLIDESKTDVMSVISEYQKKGKILDIKLEEISTEEVIKKIYEGEVTENDKDNVQDIENPKKHMNAV